MNDSALRIACDYWRVLGSATDMVLLILLIVLAIATGLLGALIKGAFWLFILTVVFLVAAYFAGKARSKT